MGLDRSKKNIIFDWWWTVDRLMLLAIICIIAVGAMLVTSSSPVIAERIGFDSYYFVKRQLVFIMLASVVVVTVSLLSPTAIRRLGICGFAVSILLLITVLLIGVETNGAKRWVSLFGFSLQPSEFMKPFFIVVTAWILAKGKAQKQFNGFKYSMVLYVVLVALIIPQPDFGMVVLVSAVWAGQIFIAGISMMWIAAFILVAEFGAFAAYMLLPHVKKRIDNFVGSASGDGNYQVQKSLEAFNSGGVFGTGPGEGVVKHYLPDSHTDFIFAVVGEEFGVIACIILVFTYGFILFRGFKLVLVERNLFIIYAVAGLLMQFGIQAIVNMGVSLNLLPTKGMTLPFVSYGGSSMLAMAIGMGMMLALTRRKYGKLLTNKVRNF